MRVAAYQLLADRVRDVAQGELARLIGDHRLHQHLEQDVAQLLAELWHRPLVNRFQDFVGLFQQGRSKRCVGLFAIPGAAARRAKPPHDVDQRRQSLDIVSHDRAPAYSTR